jgi:hypothetical protein
MKIGSAIEDVLPKKRLMSCQRPFSSAPLVQRVQGTVHLLVP